MTDAPNPDTEARLAQRAARLAFVCAAIIIAAVVGAKATRDALFFNNFPVTKLPLMLIAAAGASLVAAFVNGRLMRRHGPGRVMVPAFLLSAVLYGIFWVIVPRYPAPTAVLLYLHIAALGPVLVSGFWSLVNERFDPRTGRKTFGRIAGASTIGGVIGGVAAERMGASFGLTGMLPVLGALHFFSAILLLGIRRNTPVRVEPKEASGLGRRALSERPYLKQLALLMALATMAAAFLDYVFKSEVTGIYSGAALLRFFAAFYTAVGVATFLLQWFFARFFLEKLGPVRTAAMLSWGVFLGGLGALVVPGLKSILLVRGGESGLRSSFFQSGYELLYTPIAPRQKRAAKALIDVGVQRVSDAVGGLGIQLVLLLAPLFTREILLISAAILGALGLFSSYHLRRGYVEALGRSLLRQGSGRDDLPARKIHETLTDIAPHESIDLTVTKHSLADVPLVPTFEGAAYIEDEEDLDEGASILEMEELKQARAKYENSLQRSASKNDSGPQDSGPDQELESPQDPLAKDVGELRSGDPARVRAALLRIDPEDPTLAVFVIRLLAWDQVYREALQALRRIAPRSPGLLLDALLDAKQDFAVRRRVPRALHYCPQQRVVDGLMQALDDPRFEVRFQCGRALAYLVCEHPEGKGLSVSRELVHRALHRETRVDRRVWEGRRLLDERQAQGEKQSGEFSFFDEYVRYRSNRSIEHLFSLLALIEAPDPLRVAYQGLFTEDRQLRGTALEYLESILPTSIGEALLPLLEGKNFRRDPGKPKESVLEELLRSQVSIELNLKELRDRLEREDR